MSFILKSSQGRWLFSTRPLWLCHWSKNPWIAAVLKVLTHCSGAKKGSLFFWQLLPRFGLQNSGFLMISRCEHDWHSHCLHLGYSCLASSRPNRSSAGVGLWARSKISQVRTFTSNFILLCLVVVLRTPLLHQTREPPPPKQQLPTWAGPSFALPCQWTQEGRTFDAFQKPRRHRAVHCNQSDGGLVWGLVRWTHQGASARTRRQ